jgi:hypothetical protein
MSGDVPIDPSAVVSEKVQETTKGTPLQVCQTEQEYGKPTISLLSKATKDDKKAIDEKMQS